MIGQQIEQYRIEKELGQGGMGVVYRATDINLKREVALKVMHPHLAAREQFRKRFQQEAQAAANLDHPNIIRIWQFGFSPQDDQLFLAMEYVPGGSLRDHIERVSKSGRRLDLSEAVELVQQAADALDYAHKREMVHRDVKPDNVLLKPGDDDSFRVVLTDFGLAKLAEGLVQSVAGQPMGTFPYMSPEQCYGEEVDHRTDIYALAIMLYEVAVGTLPFKPTSITEAIRMHTQEPLPSELYDSGLPQALIDIIEKGTAKNPEVRYQTGGEMAQALRDVQIGQAQEYVTMMETMPEAVGHIGTFMADDKGPQEVPLYTQQPEATADRLPIVSNDKPTRTVKLTKDVVSIGRADDNDVTLDSRRVSGRHARIERTTDGTYVIVDLGSTNGTWLNDAQLIADVPEPLPFGKTVQVGDFWLKLEQAAPDQAAATEEVQKGAVLRSQPRGTVADSPPARQPASSGAAKAALTVTPEHVEIEPGGRVDVNIELLNEGDIVEHYDIEVTGVPPSWVTTPYDAVQLLPGDSRTTQVTFHPPRNPRSVADTYSYQIVVGGRRTPSPSTVGGTLVVKPFQGHLIDIQPQRLRNQGRTTLTLTNSGNVATDFNILARDREGVLKFAFQPGPFRVGPGQDAQIPISVKTPRRPLLGGRETIGFEIGAEAANQQQKTPPQMRQGELVKTPVIPVWLPIVGATLFGLAVMAFAIAAGAGLININPEATQLAQATAAIATSDAAETQTQVAGVVIQGTAGRLTADAERTAAQNQLTADAINRRETQDAQGTEQAGTAQAEGTAEAETTGTAVAQATGTATAGTALANTPNPSLQDVDFDFSSQSVAVERGVTLGSISVCAFHNITLSDSDIGKTLNVSVFRAAANPIFVLYRPFDNQPVESGDTLDLFDQVNAEQVVSGELGLNWIVNQAGNYVLCMEIPATDSSDPEVIGNLEAVPVSVTLTQ